MVFIRSSVFLNRIAIVLSLVVALCGIPEDACARSSKRSRKLSTAVTAQGVYAYDHTKGKVLFSRNARKKFQPASTVKLLTALVVLDRLELDENVKITRSAVNVEPTKAGLTLGASYSVKELLEVLLATSANDAGVALAVAVAGSESDFARLMNKKARSLGCRNSNFVNATGLPNKKQLTCAYDLFLITRAAMRNPFVESTMKKKTVRIQGSDGRLISRNNHNKLLWRVSEPCVLGKTGYTRTALHCYAGIAYFDDRNVSVVILKSRKPWADLAAILGLKLKK